MLKFNKFYFTDDLKKLGNMSVLKVLEMLNNKIGNGVIHLSSKDNMVVDIPCVYQISLFSFWYNVNITVNSYIKEIDVDNNNSYIELFIKDPYLRDIPLLRATPEKSNVLNNTVNEGHYNIKATLELLSKLPNTSSQNHVKPLEFNKSSIMYVKQISDNDVLKKESDIKEENPLTTIDESNSVLDNLDYEDIIDMDDGITEQNTQVNTIDSLDDIDLISCEDC